MKMQQAETYGCPKCAEQIQKDARQCRFCSIELKWRVTFLRVPKAIYRQELIQNLLKISIHSPEIKPKGLLASEVSFLQAQAIEQCVQHLQGTVSLTLQQDSALSLWLKPFLTTASVAVPIVIAISVSIAGAIKFGFFSHSAAPIKDNVSILDLDKKVVSEQLLPLPSSKALEESSENINFESLLAASVTVEVGSGLGSGFFIHPTGFVITNQHVVGDQKDVRVKLVNGQTFPAKVMDSRPEFDLAILKVQGDGFPYMKLGDATVLHPGQTVWSIGAPSGLDFTVNKGIVSFVGRNLNGQIMLQVDTPINKGNSGGPLINSAGEVVGVNTATIDGKDGLHFSVPINFVYMGDRALARPLFGFVQDNPKVAQWRSQNQTTEHAHYKKETPNNPESFNQRTSSLKPPTETSNQNELNEKLKEYSSFVITMNNTAEQKKFNIDALTSQLETLKSKYNNVAVNISDDQGLGQAVSKLSKQIANEHIDYADRILNLNKTKESMLTQLIELASNGSGNMSVKNQAITALNQTRSDTTFFQNLKVQSLKKIKENDATVY